MESNKSDERCDTDDCKLESTVPVSKYTTRTRCIVEEVITEFPSTKTVNSVLQRVGYEYGKNKYGNDCIKIIRLLDTDFQVERGVQKTFDVLQLKAYIKTLEDIVKRMG